MSKEKQINEIAELLCQNSVCVLDEWDMCHIPKGEYCTKCESIAKVFYNAGYRKQSEGEWVRKDGFQVCSNCDATKPIAFSTVLKITYYKCDYCPKCGAKMKGGE